MVNIVPVRTVLRLIGPLCILWLSVYPCTDGKTCADEIKMEIVVSDNSNHNHSSNERDLCSPFCICSCCSAHIQLTYTASIGEFDPLHNTELGTLYFERPLLNDAKAIWQPPKIS